MVSVIIPFFNAEKFIVHTINSCVSFPIVSEIIVIYDGDPNISFSDFCKLIGKSDKLIILHHSNNENSGPSVSRNLGIISASNSWITFLDADDYFLPNRFVSFEKFLSQGLEFDGIYEPIQYFNGSDKIYGIASNIPSNFLFHYLIRGTYGHFHTNGLIVKKDLLLKAGLFNESLELHQDSELWLKLAFYGKLINGGSSIPVSMVRLHQGNRIWKGTSDKSRFRQWKVTWMWAWNKPIGLTNKILIFRKLLLYKIGSFRSMFKKIFSKLAFWK